MICSQQLEYLEDKLRDLRFVPPDSGDQKSVLLGQLDSVRRELVEAVYANVDKVVYAKDILKDILTFALGDDEENAINTPKPKGFRLGESTHNSKRTPAVPDSLEGAAGGKPWSSYSHESYKAGRSVQTTPATQWTDDELRSNQRKYSTYSRTLMVSDEDIYGPKETKKTPDTQRYGGTIKVKESLAKAEQGLTDVVTAQSERRSVPREQQDTDDIGIGSPVPWNDRIDENMVENTGGIVTTKTRYAAPWKGESRGLGSISPDAKFGSGTAKKRADINAARLRLEYEANKKGGVAVAIGKIASLVVLVGGIAAGALAITLAANQPSTTKTPGKKQRQKKKKKETKPMYRGEADVYTIIEDGSDESVYVSEKAEWSDGEQAPVMNVHRPPASENFPSSPPDVTVAMG